MKLENQVCSLELAKKLKELGVKQESLFKWIEAERSVADFHTILVWEISCDEQYYCEDEWNKGIKAFTVAEIGEITKGFTQPSFNHGVGWINIYDKDKHNMATEADARAKMLTYLLENKLIIL